MITRHRSFHLMIFGMLLFLATAWPLDRAFGSEGDGDGGEYAPIAWPSDVVCDEGADRAPRPPCGVRGSVLR
jgi:hypothetical protein